MAIAPKTSRTTLKTYFKKNAIPKESDFAELIDAAINQGDDGIAKPMRPDGQPKVEHERVALGEEIIPG